VSATRVQTFQLGDSPIGFRDTLHAHGCEPKIRSRFLNQIFHPAIRKQEHIQAACSARHEMSIEFGENMRPKRTILCVDDNEQSLSIRKVMLETRGYRVIACATGKEALEVFKQGGIDLVLSDLIMPDFNGADLVEKIKDISPETPAILFSGKVKVYDKDLRADIFLPKGMYAPVELLERIRILLVKKRGPKKSGIFVPQNLRAAS
jgi:CheY-like chemotaxis protein